MASTYHFSRGDPQRGCAGFDFDTWAAHAEFKSRFLSGFAAEVITREFPQLAEKMHRRTAVLTSVSRNLEFLDGV